MATYLELYALRSNSELQDRVRMAVAVAAEMIRVEDVGTENHANRVTWAVNALANPMHMAEQTLWAVLASNKDLTTAQIVGASDVAIQENVDAVVDLFATG